MNPSIHPEGGRKLKLEQLILLHEEIAALVRAKVPLASGLQLLGGELRGRLGRIAASLSESLTRGTSLEEALEQHSFEFPPVYRAVVRAGLRSGRLNVALESLSVALVRIRDARESVAAGMIYPFLVILMTIFGSMILGVFVAPHLISMFHSYGAEVPGPWGWMQSFDLTPDGVVAVGVIAAALLFLLLRQGKRYLSLRKSSALSGALALLPWSRRLMNATRSGMFVEVLGLLVKNQVPLGEAIQIAAESIGDARLVAGCKQLNKKIERGERVSTGAYRDIGVPPLASWALVTGQNERDLLGLLEHAGQAYQIQAENASTLLRQYVPVIMTGLVAGSAVLFYVLSLFVPYTRLLINLG